MRQSLVICLDRQVSKMRYGIFTSTESGYLLSKKIANFLGGEENEPASALHQLTLFVQDKAAEELDFEAERAALPACKIKQYAKLADEMKNAFKQQDALIFIMAAGIVVRSIAPHIISKVVDPAVLVIDNMGRNIISLLSGHLGGANNLTVYLADKLGANPVVTTATDLYGMLAPDVLAERLHLRPVPKKNILTFNSALLAGKNIHYLLDGSLACLASYENILQEKKVDYKVCAPNQLLAVAADPHKHGDNLYAVITAQELAEADNILYLRPRHLIAGVGCRRGTPCEDILAAIDDACHTIGWLSARLNLLASTTVKADEIGIQEAAQTLGCEVKYFDNAHLTKMIEKYGLERSEFVEKTIGVGNVCEAAALSCVENGSIALPKRKYEKVTVSLIWEK